MARFDFNGSMTKRKLGEFSQMLEEIQSSIDFKVSARGWCYLMEQAGYIDKSQFNKVESAVNRCRKEGLLPVDFVADDSARLFDGVFEETVGGTESILNWMLEDVLGGAKYYHPDYWDGEEYYIQMLIEKIDVKTLFSSVCQKYRIPIANARGWSSIGQRAMYARRFKEAEERGMKCVLLYCGDLDPDGLRISDTLRKNISDCSAIEFEDGTHGYDPSNLIIDRFGLNYDFVIENNLSWIPNLITGNGKNLANPSHKNYNLPYMKEYRAEIGERKCEANALVTIQDKARLLAKQAIEKYLGSDAVDRFKRRRIEANKKYKETLEKYNVDEFINNIIDSMD